MALSKPTIDDRIVECCKRVWVRSITIGADVTLIVNDDWSSDTLREVDRSNIVFELPESDFPEGLRSGDVVEVILNQRGEDPQSDSWTVRPATTPRPNLPEPIYECTYRVVCTGLEPGNTVRLLPERDGSVISSHPHANIEGQARIVINEDTVIPESSGPIIAHATNCRGDTAISEPEGVLKTPTTLSEPEIEEPVYRCETSINLSNLTPGARVDISVTSSDGTETRNEHLYTCFSTSKPTNLGTQLSEDETITVQQRIEKPSQNIICNCEGPRSSVRVFQLTEDGIKPKIQSPVYEGTQEIWVSQQRNGAELGLSIIEPGEPNREFGPIQSNGEYKAPSNYGLAFSLPIRLTAGQTVQVIQTLCGVPGYDDVDVRPVPSELPTPSVRRPLYECGRWVVVQIPGESELRSLEGVKVRVYAFEREDDARHADLTTPINSRLENPTLLSRTAVRVKVMRSSGLRSEEWIVAQLVFGGSRRSTRSDPVQVRKEDVPPPPRVLPLYEGERCVRIENIRQGATVEVFDGSVSDVEPIARDIATDVRDGRVMICLGRSVSGNSQLTARQTLCRRSEKSRPGQIISWISDMERAHEQCRQDANKPESDDGYDAGIPEDITWNTEMAEQAQDWAEHLRDLGRIEHCKERGGDGENLFYMSRDPLSAEESVQKVLRNVCEEADFATCRCGWGWCAEQEYFTHPDRPYPDCCEELNDPDRCNAKHCGHYTQVVWHDSTTIGCGVAVDLDGKSYWVCRYRSGGNIPNHHPFGD